MLIDADFLHFIKQASLVINDLAPLFIGHVEDIIQNVLKWKKHTPQVGKVPYDFCKETTNLKL